MLPFLTIGPWQINTYSLFFALGVLAGGGFFFYRRLAVQRPVGKSAQSLLLVALAGIAGIYVSGVLNLAYELVVGSPLPVAVKNTNILGALLCGGVAAWIVCRRLGLSFWSTLDQVIPAVPLAQAIGRLGCLAAGCCYGRPTQSSLGLFLPDSDGHWAQRYPTQLLFVVANLLIFFILLAVERWAKRRGGGQGHWPFDGFLTLLYLGLYLIVRVSLDFLRGDAMPAWIGPLNSTQVAGIVGLILVLVAAARQWKKAFSLA